MLKKHKYLIVSVSWVCFVTYLSLFNLSNAPKVEIPNFDKLVHAGFHFLNTLFIYLYLKFELNHKYIKHCLILAMSVDIVYGLVIELMQKMLTETRHADFLDVAANVFGTVVAALVVKFIINKSQTLKGFFN